MTDTHVVVLYGGQSAEHDISRISASHVLAACDRSRYTISAIGITTEGDWHHADLDWSTELPLLPASGAPIDPLTHLRSISTEHDVVVVPVLHGPRGEDGTVQGLLELCGVAYVGSGVLGSSLSMDKAKSNEVLAAEGVPQADFVSVVAGELTLERAGQIADRLGLPVFVKPANMGSSVGVSKANSTDEILVAADEAFRFDGRIVVEEAIDGIEIEVGVLGNRELDVSVPGAIIPAAEFYDYDDKYTDGAAELIVPAPVSDAQRREMVELAERTYRALRAEGLARVDGFVRRSDGRIFINEINTFPGFTPISMFPRLWKESGLDYPQLIDRLIELARERHAERARVRDSSRRC